MDLPLPAAVRKGRGFIALLGLIVALVAVWGPAQAQDRYALIIGINDYESGNDLYNPVRDARDVADRLGKLGYTLVGGGAQIDLTRAELLDQVDALARRLRPGDMVFVYFAGHGSYFGDGAQAETYLIPKDDRALRYREDLPEQAVKLTALLGRLHEAQVTGVVVIDACRNLRLPSRQTGGTSTGLAMPNGRAATGLLVAYSADIGEEAADGRAGANSRFAAALLPRLDGSVDRVDDIFMLVRRDVRLASGGRQNPMVASYLTAPLYLTAALAPAPATLLPGETQDSARKREACEAGNAAACNDLGAIHEAGRGVPQDHARAAILFERACDGDVFVACRNLGILHLYGRGVARDVERAFALFETACSGGSALGCNSLGYMYRDGVGVAPDDVRAVALYQSACDGGSAEGCSSLGFMYAEGRAVPRDDTRAARLYDQACQGGSAPGCANLGFAYANARGVPHDDRRAASTLRRACDGNDVAACSGLAFHYDAGLGVERDLPRALYLYRRACDADFGPACGNLGRMYAEGRGGIANLSLARTALRRGCALGYPYACEYEAYLNDR
ncbi:caspase family protein [Brevundimonas sp.]|uniref:caspase family protein n=1 Tax=Brevundimonas sp. TaxID=1871086 RepID=UPI001D5767DF|nr:caspase family protein [Brevundimonas sp.]MBL0947451.1 SEL1-like repeat protein [Brevundimonas sp.]